MSFVSTEYLGPIYELLRDREFNLPVLFFYDKRGCMEDEKFDKKLEAAINKEMRKKILVVVININTVKKHKRHSTNISSSKKRNH